jgi:hypothetical protein
VPYYVKKLAFCHEVTPRPVLKVVGAVRKAKRLLRGGSREAAPGGLAGAPAQA